MTGLISKYLLGGAALLCVILTIMAWGFHAERDTARAQVETWKERAGMLVTANEALANAIEKQNAYVKLLKAVADQRGADAQKRVVAAVVLEKPREERAARIIRVPITDNECESLKAKIDEARR